MTDNVIPFPQKPAQSSEPPEPKVTWSFDMEDETGSIFSVTYDTAQGDFNMIEVSDGYIEHLCQTLCESVRKNPELEEYVSGVLERMIRQIRG